MKKGAVRPNGSVPIMGRISIDGKSVQLSTKLDICPDYWNQEKQRVNSVKGYAIQAKDTNERLDYIISRMNEIYREISDQDLYVTAEKVKNTFFGHNIRERTLLALYDSHLKDLEKAKNIRVTETTIDKHRRTFCRLQEFLKTEYQRSDIALTEIDHTFIVKWESFLRINYHLGHNSAGKVIQMLKTVILKAQQNDSILSFIHIFL